MLRIDEEALNRLHKNLRFAGKLFDKSAADRGRTSVILSLTAVSDFFRSIGGLDPLVQLPLHQLQYALNDLERGILPELLTPRKIDHRPPDSSSDAAFRALAAVAMDLLMLGKVSRKEAARRVARSLSNMGYAISPTKPITAQRVEDWRDRIREERPAEAPPTARFHRLKDQALQRFPQDPIAAAEFLLHRLPAVVPPRNPEKPPS